jgi:hypothetical protein
MAKEERQSPYPLEIARDVMSRFAKYAQARFYQSVADIVLDEVVRDLNMQANAYEVELGMSKKAHSLRLAATAITDLRKTKKYPSEVKFE